VPRGHEGGKLGHDGLPAELLQQGGLGGRLTHSSSTFWASQGQHGGRRRDGQPTQGRNKTFAGAVTERASRQAVYVSGLAARLRQACASAATSLLQKSRGSVDAVCVWRSYGASRASLHTPFRDMARHMTQSGTQAWQVAQKSHRTHVALSVRRMPALRAPRLQHVVGERFSDAA
jgi:hypothetical protein